MEPGDEKARSFALSDDIEAPTTKTGGEAGWVRYLRRATEAYFRRWPFYVLLLVACVALGVNSLRQLGQSYTSAGSVFVETRTLIESQSADEYESYLARLTASGYVVQDLNGLIGTDAFMTLVADKAGVDLGESAFGQEAALAQLRLVYDTDVISDNLVRVQATTGDPERSQVLTLAVIEAYIEFQISAAAAESVVAEEFFGEAIVAVSEDLIEARQEVDRFATQFESLRTIAGEDRVELDRLREAEAEAEAQFRAAADNIELARLVRARAETLAAQRFSYVTEPRSPGTQDAAGFDGVLRIFSFVLIGLALSSLAPLVAGVRSRTVLIPSDLTQDPNRPLLAVLGNVPRSRLDPSRATEVPAPSPDDGRAPMTGAAAGSAQPSAGPNTGGGHGTSV